MDTLERAVGAAVEREWAKRERVGVIVVHGIGEQKRGDHLEEVVRSVAEGLGDDDGKRSGRCVSVHTRIIDENPARVSIDVRWRDRDSTVKLTEIVVHEVHWADINEPNSIGKGLRFWLWGLSAWLTPGKFDVSKDIVFSQTMATPRFPKRDPTKQLMFGDRFGLFIVGWLFLLAAPLIVVADFIAKKVFNTTLPASLQTVVSYVSAVKLYTQERRAGQGLLESCNEVPRFAIRRRMAAVVAEVATAKYARWYVLAHSQGTVVAFNGIMASARVWSNYLDDTALEKLRKAEMAGEPRNDEVDGPKLDAIMADLRFRPAIPPSLTGNDVVVFRDRLFAQFRGLLTYGSPLDKFAAIWPPTVPISRYPSVFSPEAVWVNVWDPTDPVGGSLDAFNPWRALDLDEKTKPTLPGTAECTPLAFFNIPCRASGVYLASHVAYLRSLTGKTQVLSRWIGDWLLGIAAAADLTDEIAAERRLVGRRADTTQASAAALDAAWRWRGRISLWVSLLLVIPLLLQGWVEIFGFLRATAPSYLPGPLAATVSWLTAPIVWLYDTIGQNAPHWCVSLLVQFCLNQLAGATAVSLALLAIAGPIGRWLTPLDPRDSRSSDTVFMYDLRRAGAVVGVKMPEPKPKS